MVTMLVSFATRMKKTTKEIFKKHSPHFDDEMQNESAINRNSVQHPTPDTVLIHVFIKDELDVSEESCSGT